MAETAEGKFKAEVSFSEEVMDEAGLSEAITKLVIIGLLTINEDEDIDKWEIAGTIAATPVDKQSEIEEFEAVRDSYYSLWG